MASTRYVEIIKESTPTYDTIYFSFEAGVTTTQAGNYFIRYQVGSKSKVDTNTFYISAGGTYSTYEFEQTGLEPGTTYTINATLYVAANKTAVAYADSIKITTKSAPTYYGKVILDGNGGTYGSGITTTTFNGRVTSTSSSARISIAYADPGFVRDGYTLIGFSTRSSATSASYDVDGTYTVKSTSTSSSSPTTVRLYAVWKKAQQTYYGRVILDGNGGTYYSGGVSNTTWSYDGSSSPTTSSYAMVSIKYADPGFTKSGKTLIGFADTSTATSAIYSPSGTYTVKAESTSSSSPTKIRLYAVWGAARPSNWSWKTKNIGQGLSLNVNSNGEPTPLTASEWLEFITRIEAFSTYCGVTLSSTYLSNARTDVKSGLPMTKTQANGARNLIYQMNAYVDPEHPVPGTVSSNRPVTADFINGLMESLNSIYK